MIEQFETQKELASIFEGIEGQLDRSLAVQKDSIEKSLQETVNREKAEAQKRVEAAERDFAESKHVLERHRSALAELKTAREQIQGQIKGHLDRALSCRQMMEKMSAQAYEEFEKIHHLGMELDGIRHRTEEETEQLRKHLEDRYGIKAQFQAAFEALESVADLKQEMLKMKKVRELLESEAATVAGTADAEETELVIESRETPPAESRIEPPAEGPRDYETAQKSSLADFYAQEAGPEEAESQDAAPAAPEMPRDFEQEELRDLVDRLARYRQTESVLNGTEFAYFLKGKKMVLDGESFVGTVGKISEIARGLHANLGQKEMSKDLFLIKQEILNQQEILRKAFLRVVRFCEKEDGTLPEFIADVLNVRILKDVLERLTFGNWSNPADFAAFSDHTGSLKLALRAKFGDQRDYLLSVLEQLEGGPAVMS
ncbi:MAG: hypothetical protein ABFD80_08740 [Acidobacteriota bacterium]